MKTKLFAGVSAVAGFLALAGSAFAQTVTPPPLEVNADVVTTIKAGITDYISALLANFAWVIIPALGLAISIGIVYFVLRHFHGLGRH
jgi:hypothetical protein